MVVEIAQDRGIPTTSSEAGITPFTERATQVLAIQFITNKDQSAHTYHGRDAYVLGELEVQGQVLTMLGQEHLLEADPDQPLPIPLLARIQPIRRGDVDNLVGSYRVAQEFCLDVELKKARTKMIESKPGEQRIEGRRDTLAEILTNLGQGHIVRSIDSELRMRPKFVQWERERDIRSKGQTF